jgi:hypothetical protein
MTGDEIINLALWIALAGVTLPAVGLAIEVLREMWSERVNTHRDEED